MKKIVLMSTVILLCFSLFGCSVNKINGTNTEEFSLNDSVKKAIDKYNSTVKDSPEINFPTTMKSGNIVTKTIQIGGKEGNTTKLDMSISAEKDGNMYIVTLTKDYNITVNGTKAISSWKYEIAKDRINLLDKRDNGKLINNIK